MNKKEKEALDILNTFIFRQKTKNYNKLSLEDTESVKKVLNLIDKQQKEIEEYKELLDDRLWNEHISKETETMWKNKIKEKIKEWDVSIKWANADDRYYCIKILKELLGEENE